MSSPKRKTTPATAQWNILDEGSFAALYQMAPPARVHMVREGAPPDFLKTLSSRTGIARETLYVALGLAPSTMKRKLSRHHSLSADESERALSLARLIGQVETMLEQSSSAEDFDAAAWLGRWLERSNPALDGARPVDFLDTADGRQMIADLLARMQSGAYS